MKQGFPLTPLVGRGVGVRGLETWTGVALCSDPHPRPFSRMREKGAYPFRDSLKARGHDGFKLIRHIHLMCVFLTLALLFSLSACSNLSLPAATTSSQSVATRHYHPQIDISGRLSVQYEQNNKPQAVHIRFGWSQTPQQTEITLSSPTGQTLATLLVNEQGAQLNQAGKPPQFASDANQLLLETLGWPLPVNNLRYWIQGFIRSEEGEVYPLTSKMFPEGSYLIGRDSKSFEGWSLIYPAWEKESAQTHIERPKRIDLTNQIEQAGLVSVRIAIDEWNPQ